ncbi:MAG: hypothetical protein ABEH64_03790 [Salinirussus sp.]
MAGGTQPGAIVAEQSGVSLRKRGETGDIGRPAVAVVLDAEGIERQVTVRLIESLPEALGPADIGFFESEGHQPWTIKGPKLVLETQLEPGETRESWIGARGEHAHDIKELLGEPDTMQVHPSDTDSRESLAERLLTELRSDTVSPETKRQLLSELRSQSRPCQSEVSGNRSQPAVMADLAEVKETQQELATTVEELSRVMQGLPFIEDASADTLTIAAGANTGNEADIAELTSRQADLEATVERLAEEIQTLSDDLERLEHRVPEGDTEERLAELADRVETVSEFTTGIQTALEQ